MDADMTHLCATYQQLKWKECIYDIDVSSKTILTFLYKCMEKTISSDYSTKLLPDIQKRTRVITDLTLISQVGVLKYDCVRKTLIYISYASGPVQRLVWNTHGTEREQRRSRGSEDLEGHFDETQK